MKRKAAFLTALMLLASLALAGCSKSASTAAAPRSNTAAEPQAPAPEGESGYGGLRSATDSTASAGGNTAVQEAKLIRRATLELQTLNFDEAREALDALKDQCGGYYEDASVSGGDYNAKNGNRYASYTVRVPKERYNAFISAAGELAHLVNIDERQQDVGETYYDTELRLETQRTKYERLLALLDKADQMEDIISLENAISDTQYLIDQYSAELRKYDSLVDYSSIEIYLREVVAITDQPGEAESFGARLGKALSSGFTSFGRTMGDLAVWSAYNLIGIVLILAVAGTTVTIVIKKRKKFNTPPELPAQEEQPKT